MKHTDKTQHPLGDEGVTLTIRHLWGEPDEDDDAFVMIPNGIEVNLRVLDEQLAQYNLAVIPAEEEPASFTGTHMLIWCYRTDV